MNIIFLAPDIFTLGGLQKVVTSIANQLSVNHNVTIVMDTVSETKSLNRYGLNSNIVLKEFNFSAQYIESGFRYHLKRINRYLCRHGIEFKYLQRYTFFPDKQQRCIYDYIEKNNTDIVIGAGDYYTAQIALLSPKLKAKTIGWQHSSYKAWYENTDFYTRGYKKLMTHALNSLDAYVVLCNYFKKEIEANLRIKATVIPNPISFSSTEISQCDMKQFIAVGRLVEAKGFKYLLEAFKIFNCSNKEWNLAIYGEGDKRPLLEKYINDNSLQDFVHLYGDTTAIQEKLLNASVFCLSSKWEGFSIAAVEALEMGLPVISFDLEPIIDTSPQTSIVNNGENGIIVPHYDTVKFAEAMLFLAAHDTERKEMGQKSKQKAKKYAINDIMNKWTNLFSAVLHE